MISSNQFTFSGETNSRMKPGFSTPVYTSRDSNHSFIQKFNENDYITGFSPIDNEWNPIVSYSYKDIIRKVGNKTLYLYHDISGEAHLDTKLRLKKILLHDYDNLREKPYLKRTIARFINDKEKLSSANKEIKRIHSEFIWHHSDANYERESISNIFIHVSEYEQISKSIAIGDSILLLGRRGSGKTAIILRLENEIYLRGNSPLCISCSSIRLSYKAKSVDNSSNVLSSFIEILRTSLNLKHPHNPFNSASSDFQQLIDLIRREHGSILLIDNCDFLLQHEEEVAHIVDQLHKNEIVCVMAIFDYASYKNYYSIFSRFVTIVLQDRLTEQQATRMIDRSVVSNLAQEIGKQEKNALLNILKNLNFREGGAFLNSISRKSKLNITDLKQHIFEHFDNRFLLQLSGVRKDVNISNRRLFLAVLDELAIQTSADQPIRSEIKMFPENSQPNQAELFGVSAEHKVLVFPDEFKEELDQLEEIGMVKRDINGSPQFVSRILADWWRRRRPALDG